MVQPANFLEEGLILQKNQPFGGIIQLQYKRIIPIQLKLPADFEILLKLLIRYILSMKS